MIKRIAPIAVLAASISACVSVQPARDIPITTTNSKTFTFDKTPAPGVELTQSQILSGLKSQIAEAASHKYGCNPMCNTPKGYGPGYFFEGAIIERNADSYVVTYRKGDTYRSTTGTMMEAKKDITAKLPVKVEEIGDSWVVQLSSPSMLHKTKGNDDMFLFKTDAKAISQYNKLLSKLDPVILAEKVETGEFKVSYDPESVATSLNRKLQAQTRTTTKGGALRTVYNLKSGEHSAIAEVKIYLNKGSSLVEYSIKQKFNVDANGGSSFDGDAFKSFKQQLVDAANS